MLCSLVSYNIKYAHHFFLLEKSIIRKIFVYLPSVPVISRAILSENREHLLIQRTSLKFGHR